MGQLRRMKAGVTGDWIKLHNEELHDLYSPLNIIRMIKLWEMKGAEHVARTGREKFCIESLKTRDYSVLGVDERIIRK
jgi:hypothetical protein